MATYEIQHEGQTLELDSASELTPQDIQSAMDAAMPKPAERKIGWKTVRTRGEAFKALFSEYPAASVAVEQQDANQPSGPGFAAEDFTARPDRTNASPLPGFDESGGAIGLPPGLPSQLAATAGNVALQTGKILTDPKNMALAGGMGAVGLAGKAIPAVLPLAQKGLAAVQALFAGTMAPDAVDAAKRAHAVHIDPSATPQEKTQATADAVFSGGMTFLALLGAVHSISPALAEELSSKTVPGAIARIRQEAVATKDAAERAALEKAANDFVQSNTVPGKTAQESAQVLSGLLPNKPAEASAGVLSTELAANEQRAKDFTIARTEQALQAAKDNALAGGESTVTETPMGTQEAKMDTRPGEQRRERARLAREGQEPKPAGVLAEQPAPDLSAQADKVLAESGFDPAGNPVRPNPMASPLRSLTPVERLAKEDAARVAAAKQPAPAPLAEIAPEELSAPPPPSKAAEITPSTDASLPAEGAVKPGIKRNDAGFIDPKLLFSTPLQSALQGTAGAVYGSTQGDTPEERRQNMLKYGALGVLGGMATAVGGRALIRATARRGVVLEIDKHLAPPPAKPLMDRAAELPNSVRAATVTVFAPLDKLHADVAKEVAPIISILPRDLPLSREFEQVAGAAGKAAQDVRDYSRAVLDQVGDKDRQNFDRIVALKRIEQRLAWNDAHGSDRKVVGDWTHTKVASDMATLEGAIGAKRVVELDNIASTTMQQEADDALRLQVTSGRMSQEMYDQIKADNDFYAPFKVLDVMQRYDGGHSGIAVDTRDQLAKAITGLHSEDFHIENPSVALAQHIFKARILADKNLKMLELAKLADYGSDLIKNLVPGQEPRRGFEAVNYFDNGSPMRLEVSPEVAAAVKGLNATETGMLANFARRFAGVFRFGATTANVAFQPVNFLLADQPGVWLVSKYGLQGAREIAQAPVDFASGVYASMFSNLLGGEGGVFQKATAGVPVLGRMNTAAAKLARAFNESGAAGSNWQQLVDTMGGTVDEKTVLNGLKIGENTLLDHIGAINKTIEEASKMMGFKRGMRIEGIDQMTPAQAEQAIKTVVAEVRNFAGSPDFQRAGWMVKDFNNLAQMFLNVRVQGVTNLTARLAGADGAKPAAAAWLRIGGSIGTGAAYLWYANHRPENTADYEARSANERNNYFLSPRYDATGKPLYSTNDQGDSIREYWRIPKREVLQYLGNTVEAALDFANKENPETVTKFGVQLMENLSPVNISGKNASERIESVVGGANPMIKVPYEQLSGRDTFRHRDILATQDMQRASPENQFTDTTPKIFVKAANAMPSIAPDNLRSPLMLQHAVEGFTGRALTQFFPGKQPEGRDPTAAAIANNPLVGRMVGPLYADHSKEQDAIDALKREESDTRIEGKRSAGEAVKQINAMTPDAQAAELRRIHDKEPELFKAISNEMLGSTKDTVEKQLLQMNPVSRAKFIDSQIQRMKPEDQTAYVTRLSQGPEPVITKAVREALVPLIEQGLKSTPPPPLPGKKGASNTRGGLPVLSPDEAAKAPPGIAFVGTNGKTYEKLKTGKFAIRRPDNIFAAA